MTRAATTLHEPERAHDLSRADILDLLYREEEALTRAELALHTASSGDVKKFARPCVKVVATDTFREPSAGLRL